MQRKVIFYSSSFPVSLFFSPPGSSRGGKERDTENEVDVLLCIFKMSLPACLFTGIGNGTRQFSFSEEPGVSWKREYIMQVASQAQYKSNSLVVSVNIFIG